MVEKITSSFETLLFENGKYFLQLDVKKTEDQSSLLEERRVYKDDLIPSVIYKSNREISDY